MKFKTFKKLISVLPNNVSKTYGECSFNPLVIADNKIIICDGAIIIIYNEENIDKNTKISINSNNYNILLKSHGNNVEFKDTLYIDDVSYENSDDFMIYNNSEQLFKDANDKNIYTMPLINLENCECKSLVLNCYGIHYFDIDNKLLKSVPFDIPNMCNVSKQYISFQYKYIYNILKLYKNFNIIPTIKFGSSRNIVFDSLKMKCILMQYNISSSINFGSLQCNIDTSDW